MLTVDGGVLEVGYQKSGKLNGVLGGDMLAQADKYLGVSTSNYSRVVYTQNSSWEYLVTIPAFTSQWRAPGELAHADWHVDRIGWILVAKRPLQSNSEGSANIERESKIDVINGFASEVSAIFLQRLPANPAFLARTIPGFNGIAGGITVYGELKKQVVHISNTYDSSVFIGSDMHSIPKNSEKTNSLYVSIQSGILQLASNDLLRAINSVIARAYHFEKTTPSFFSASGDEDTIGILIQEGSFAIGVSGKSNNFDKNVIGALAKEQGERHPQRKGFLLPDGTLGHEYVPSDPKVTFSSTQESDCENSQGYDDSIILCTDSGNIVTVSTQKDVAKMLVQNLKEGRQKIFGSVTGDMIEKLFPNNSFQKIFFSGDEKGIDAWVFL
ncbi:MAG: hypothetical protein ABIP54_01135 [Candidatus Andersenbacteria bacterium]